MLLRTRRRCALAILILAPLGELTSIARQDSVTIARPPVSVRRTRVFVDRLRLLDSEVGLAERKLLRVRDRVADPWEAVKVVRRLASRLVALFELDGPHDPLLDETEHDDCQSRKLFLCQGVDEQRLLVINVQSRE